MERTINNMVLLISILLISCCLSLSSLAQTITTPSATPQPHHFIHKRRPTHHHRYHHYHPRYRSTKPVAKKTTPKKAIETSHHSEVVIRHHHHFHHRYHHSYHSAKHSSVVRDTQDKPNIVSDNSDDNAMTTNNSSNIPPPSFTENERNHVMNYVHQTLDRLRYSRYKLGGTYFNLISGVYKVDCSEYVDQLLRNAVPTAYHDLVACVRTPHPTSEDYYVFLSNLLSDQEQHDWYRIESVANLEPGDIIVFRYKKLYFHHAAGHVMVVVNTPILDRIDDDVYLVRVSDSAPSGHSDDTRPPHTSGIGEGTLLLKVDPQTGLPYAYAWKIGAPWEYDMDFAMGRPSNV